MILYFSGTGNSEYAARRISTETKDKLMNLGERIRSRDFSGIHSDTPLGGSRSHLCVENPPRPGGMAEKHRIKGKQKHLFCNDLRRKHRKRRQIPEKAGPVKRSGLQGLRPDCHARKLHCHVHNPHPGRSSRNNPRFLKDNRRSRPANQGQQAIPPASHNTKRQNQQQHSKHPLLPNVRPRQKVPGNQCLHILRQMRRHLPPKQHPSEKRNPGLGKKLHPLHGLHQPLSNPSHRIRKPHKNPPPLHLPQKYIMKINQALCNSHPQGWKRQRT